MLSEEQGGAGSSPMAFYALLSPPHPAASGFSPPYGYQHFLRALNDHPSSSSTSSAAGGEHAQRSLIGEGPLAMAAAKHAGNAASDGGGAARFAVPAVLGSTTAPWSWNEAAASGGKRSPAAAEIHGGGGGVGGGDDKRSTRTSVAAAKMKKVKARRKVREPRFCFKTMSDVDVLDDGYKWRKYGQKVVKNTQHPRSYYRCTQDNCRVKKRVERLAEDPRMVITTYEGRHAHSPSHDGEENGKLPLAQINFFW